MLHINLETGKSKKVAFDGTRIFGINHYKDSLLLVGSDSDLHIINYSLSHGTSNYKIVKTINTGFRPIEISPDNNGNLWLGSSASGIFKCNNYSSLLTEKPSFSVFTSATDNIRISCINNDFNDYCWLGSYNKGIYRFNLKKTPFSFYNTQMRLPYSITTNEILSIVPVNENSVLITANSGGIACFNTITESFEPLPFPSVFNHIVVAKLDSENNIWLGTGGTNNGLYYYQKGKNNIIHLSNQNLEGFQTSNVKIIEEDQYGNFWIVCSNEIFKLKRNELGQVIHSERLSENPFFENLDLILISTFFVDSAFNLIWVGTEKDGLFRLKTHRNPNIEDIVIEQYEHSKEIKNVLPNNFVSCITRLPDNSFWVGTESGGISKVINSTSKPEFHILSEKDGLSSNVVKRVQYDEDGFIWIATNRGLDRFNPQDNSFRNFSAEDGLPINSFEYGSAKLPNGLLFFSGREGFCYFNPDNIPNADPIPQITFGDFQIYNQTIVPGEPYEEKIVLDKILARTKSVKLNYKQNVFAIEILSLHYSNPENHSIRYRLLPDNDKWIELNSNNRFASFNGLQPGNYQFEAMASNSNNDWTRPIALEIEITPPFWKTLWAYMFYVLLLSAIILIVFQYFLNINSLKHKLEIEQLEKNQVREVNKAKLQFFTNISHEFRTPLTLISGPLEMLLTRFKRDLKTKELVELIQRQSQKMLELVEQVHDFQKADQNHLKIDRSKFNFSQLIASLKEDFDQLALDTKKSLVLTEPPEELYITADKRKLEKILNNLLNNAFKFTKADDVIAIDYSAEPNRLVFSVSDTGKGIDPEDLPHIFERFYQSRKNKQYTSGSGIGLAFSKHLVEMHYGTITAVNNKDSGVCFKVMLPCKVEKQDNSEAEKVQGIIAVEKQSSSGVSVIKSGSKLTLESNSEFNDQKIFLVEDNDDLRAFLADNLSEFFKIETYADGKDCLKAMENDWPDLIISDILMPEVNGIELCTTLKSDIRTCHIPIVLITACSSLDDRLQGLKVGADAYIQKPFDMQHLITRTEMLLKNRKQLRERFQNDFPLSIEKKSSSQEDIVFLEKFYAILDENLDETNIDITAVARKLYLNRTQFYQKIKAVTNQTPFDIIRTHRLKKAAELLVQKKLSVSEVYVLTGYKDRTHFSKVFKEHYKVSPGKYGKENGV